MQIRKLRAETEMPELVLKAFYCLRDFRFVYGANMKTSIWINSMKIFLEVSFFLIQIFFYSKYALLHTIQLLNAQFSVTNSTYTVTSRDLET